MTDVIVMACQRVAAREGSKQERQEGQGDRICNSQIRVVNKRNSNQSKLMFVAARIGRIDRALLAGPCAWVHDAKSGRKRGGPGRASWLLVLAARASTDADVVGCSLS